MSPTLKVYSISLILLSYLLLRLSSLITIPFMQDEAEYLFWAKTIISDPHMFLISLSQGVKPFYVWLQIPFLLLGRATEIHEARLVSLTAGMFTMLGLYLLSKELFKNKTISILSVLIFIFFPYAQIYNSVSVFEGTVSAFIIFALLISIKLVRKPKLLLAIAFGTLVGFGILTKKHASFTIYLLPFSFLFFPTSSFNFKKIRTICLLFLLAVIIAIGMQQILKTSEYFERIAWYEGGTIYPKKAWLMMPLSEKISIFIHTSRMWTSMLSYLTLPYVLLIGFSLTLYKKYWREITILMSYFLIPSLSMAFFAVRAEEHWTYPMVITLIPLIALGMYTFTEKLTNSIKKKSLKSPYISYSLYALWMLYPVYFITMIIFQPLSSPLVFEEKEQYYYCHLEMFLPDKPILEQAAKDKKILIGTENDKGFKNFMAIHLWDNKNIEVKGYWPKVGELPQELEVLSKKMPVYYATLRRNTIKLSADSPVRIISQRIDPSKACTYVLYKVN